MQNVLIVIHLIIVVALVGVVLLQRSEGGGLGMGSGGGGGVGGFMTGRGQANALTRATAILAGLFFLTSIVLAVMANRGRVQRSIIDGAPATTRARHSGRAGRAERPERRWRARPAAPDAEPEPGRRAAADAAGGAAAIGQGRGRETGPSLLM
ncbi:preprotein translocase subunit SecG [Bosea thiooxidans]|uniref:preprotein translocase subunit SecG n=1 Tax=Bosea thiooxidans TaxID=53254 RepID=UPI0009E842DF|nr:preprotein translocase subunit SecG [Bosea thiooxidans]